LEEGDGPVVDRRPVLPEVVLRGVDRDAAGAEAARRLLDEAEALLDRARCSSAQTDQQKS
jgi:hypothetical protein